MSPAYLVSCAWPPVNRKSSSQARSGAVNRRAPRLANVVPPANCAAHWCRRKGMESEAVSWAVASIGDRTNAQQIAKREANTRASGEGVGGGREAKSEACGGGVGGGRDANYARRAWRLATSSVLFDDHGVRPRRHPR